MREEEKNIWLKLYEVASKIEKLEPWKKLWDCDLFVYTEDDDPKKTLYFCTMGRGGIHKSIAIYDNTHINDLLELFNRDHNGIMSVNYQQCLKVCYLPKKETMPENIKLIKNLGLKYKNEWISFEKFEIGYGPYIVDNINDLTFLTKALNTYYEMYTKYINDNMQIAFENGDVFVRNNNTKDEIISDKVENIFNIERINNNYEEIEISKKIIDDINNAKTTNMELEFEFLNYIPLNIMDQKEQNGRFKYPLLFTIIDRKTEFVFSINLNDKEEMKNMDKYCNECIAKLRDIILQIGKPKRIYVRDEKTKNVLTNFAKETNIDIAIDGNLSGVDFMVDTFLNNDFM